MNISSLLELVISHPVTSEFNIISTQKIEDVAGDSRVDLLFDVVFDYWCRDEEGEYFTKEDVEAMRRDATIRSVK